MEYTATVQCSAVVGCNGVGPIIRTLTRAEVVSSVQDLFLKFLKYYF